MSFSTLAISIIAGVVPSFIWLYFWLREDIEHPEPRWLIVISFLAGGIAVLIAIFGEKYVGDVVIDRNLKYVIWAALEEASKFMVIIFVALRSRYDDEPIDAMVYMITIALGFAAIENVLFILEPVIQGNIMESVATQSMRFVGATLVHTVSSAMIGFAIGLAFYRGRIAKIFSAAIGFSAAVALHSAFNLSIINASPLKTIQVFAWIWVAVVILLLLFEEIKAVRPKLSAN